MTSHDRDQRTTSKGRPIGKEYPWNDVPMAMVRILCWRIRRSAWLRHAVPLHWYERIVLHFPLIFKPGGSFEFIFVCGVCSDSESGPGGLIHVSCVSLLCCVETVGDLKVVCEVTAAILVCQFRDIQMSCDWGSWLSRHLSGYHSRAHWCSSDVAVTQNSGSDWTSGDLLTYNIAVRCDIVSSAVSLVMINTPIVGLDSYFV